MLLMEVVLIIIEAGLGWWLLGIG